jgi:hypothetical protein
VEAVSLSPTDLKRINSIDHAGIAAKGGKNNPRNFKISDRVGGVVYGGL